MKPDVFDHLVQWFLNYSQELLSFGRSTSRILQKERTVELWIPASASCNTAPFHLFHTFYGIFFKRGFDWFKKQQYKLEFRNHSSSSKPSFYR